MEENDGNKHVQDKKNSIQNVRPHIWLKNNIVIFAHLEKIYIIYNIIISDLFEFVRDRNMRQLKNTLLFIILIQRYKLKSTFCCVQYWALKIIWVGIIITLHFEW